MIAHQNVCQFFRSISSPDSCERYNLLDRIGEGTYGEVYSATDRISGKKVAIKILDNILDNTEEIEEEYSILKDICHHPNLPVFYDFFLKTFDNSHSNQLWLVMELCGGGSTIGLVRGLRNRGEYLTEIQLSYILQNTLQALVYLHSHHCMHRDVKGHNILLTNEADVKLVDFGVSSRLGCTMARRNTSVGTPYWMSPEVIACEQQIDSSYDSRCDIWSLGITAIELSRGEPPLSEIHPMRALFYIPRNPPPTLDREDCRNVAIFVSTCLRKDFEERPTSKELLNHPLMRKGRECAQLAKRELKEEIRRQKLIGRAQVSPEVTTKHGKLKYDHKSQPTKMYIDDLAVLDSLTEETIVEQLQHRYETNRIYTYIGDILLAINPFTTLGLYSVVEQKRHSNKIRSDNPPHIFAVADTAYQALMHQKTGQSIVISGESGAGKTESANLLLKQLVFLGKAVSRNLEDRILQMNPLMEAFGNAQTGINSNSSRFGKYLELSMTNNGQISGARVFVYLLEHSRVVQQAHGESNFHVFYYLYDGLMNNNQMKDFHLDHELRQHHSYLTGDKQDPSTRKNNINKFEEMQSAFHLIGFSDEEVSSVYKILASILHLGDIEFGEVVSEDNTDNKSKIIDMAPLHRVSHLLGLDRFHMLDCLTVNSVVMRGEIINRYNSVMEACVIRDAIAKALYSRLFDWLVNSINSILTRHIRGEPLVISILDIFGFENFTHNSFEQLCINIANEQIQYYFNRHIFTWEQQEYISEGIPVDLVEFTDNRPVLDMLLSRPMGLLALLDEESRFPRATDKSLIEKFHQNIKSKLYVRPKTNCMQFAIQHFAGKVIYHADGFLDKNRQFLPQEVIKLFCTSTVDTIKYLFQCPVTRTGNLFCSMPCNVRMQTASINGSRKTTPSCGNITPQSRTQQTVASYFRYSLAELLLKMSSGVPQFIRCIKPNDSRTPHLFDPIKVLKQLRYTGVLETIRIRQHGFSHRILFTDFIKRYSFLAFSHEEKLSPSRENCRLLLTRLKMDGWALGKSKVFLKYYHSEYLTKLYEDQVRRIILAQSCVRRYLAMLHYKMKKKELAESAITLQRYIRGWLLRKKMNIVLRNQKNNNVLKHVTENYDRMIAELSDCNNAVNNYKVERTRDDNEGLITNNNTPRLFWNSQLNDYNYNNQHNVNVQSKHASNLRPFNSKMDFIDPSNNNGHVVSHEVQAKPARKNKPNIRPFAVYDSPRPFVQRGFVQEVSRKFTEEPNQPPKEELKRPRILNMNYDAKKEAAKQNIIHYWDISPARLKFLESGGGANGPCDFRQLLRPTHDPPTESLRKRFVERFQVHN